MVKKGTKYIAEQGNFIVRKYDNFIMGEEIDLGINDKIKNYKEKAYTEEEYKEFYKNKSKNLFVEDEDKLIIKESE